MDNNIFNALLGISAQEPRTAQAQGVLENLRKNPMPYRPDVQQVVQGTPPSTVLDLAMQSVPELRKPPLGVTVEPTDHSVQPTAEIVPAPIGGDLAEIYAGINNVTSGYEHPLYGQQVPAQTQPVPSVSMPPQQSDMPTPDLLPENQPVVEPPAAPPEVDLEAWAAASPTSEAAYQKYVESLGPKAVPMSISEWRHAEYEKTVPETEKAIKQTQKDLEAQRAQRHQDAANAYGIVAGTEQRKEFEERNAQSVSQGGRPLSEEEFLAEKRKENEIQTKDDSANDVKNKVGNMTPQTRIQVEDGLLTENTPENLAEAQRIADAAANKIKGGSTMSEVVEDAKGIFGDLFSSKAFQRAFIYYLGSRLMGYSASGSGMAAGQILMQGWEQQDKLDAATAKTTAETKKAAATAAAPSKQGSLWSSSTQSEIPGWWNKDETKFYVQGEGGQPQAVDWIGKGYTKFDKDKNLTIDQQVEAGTLNTSQRAANIAGPIIAELKAKEDEVGIAKVKASATDESISSMWSALKDYTKGNPSLKINTPEMQKTVNQAYRQYLQGVAKGDFEGTEYARALVERQLVTTKIGRGSDSVAPSASVFTTGESGTEPMTGNALVEGMSVVRKARDAMESQMKAALNHPDVDEKTKESIKSAMKDDVLTLSETMAVLERRFEQHTAKKDSKKFWQRLAEGTYGDSKKSSNPFMLWLTRPEAEYGYGSLDKILGM